MANRSYLYSINVIPDKNPEQKRVIKGLTEFNWDIPLSHKLLVSSETKICDSVIWNVEEKIGLVGNYEKGVENLKKFLDIFKKQTIKNKNEFDKYYNESLTFLEDPKNQQNYILLEAGEIFDLAGEDINVAIKLLYNEINELKNQDKLSDIARKINQNWEEKLGIDEWTNILYFDFSDKEKTTLLVKI